MELYVHLVQIFIVSILNVIQQMENVVNVQVVIILMEQIVSYVINRIKNIATQKKSLDENERQAWEFYEIYQSYLLEEQGQIIRDFAGIQSANWFERRERLFRYGFWKSGILRNLGLCLLI